MDIISYHIISYHIISYHIMDIMDEGKNKEEKGLN